MPFRIGKIGKRSDTSMSHTEKIIVIDGARTGGCRKSLFPRTWDIGPNVMNHTFVLITCVNAATHTGSDRRWPRHFLGLIQSRDQGSLCYELHRIGSLRFRRVSWTRGDAPTSRRVFDVVQVGDRRQPSVRWTHRHAQYEQPVSKPRFVQGRRV